jgi:hypothetical protein
MGNDFLPKEIELDKIKALISLIFALYFTHGGT